ncbi:hypothetical protein FOXYSP1_05489 [Fusarium oxysporum f. sp. phaseoli]
MSCCVSRHVRFHGIVIGWAICVIKHNPECPHHKSPDNCGPFPDSEQKTGDEIYTFRCYSDCTLDLV